MTKSRTVPLSSGAEQADYKVAGDDSGFPLASLSLLQLQVPLLLLIYVLSKGARWCFLTISTVPQSVPGPLQSERSSGGGSFIAPTLQGRKVKLKRINPD